VTLAKQDLIDYFVSGCKTPQSCHIGTESELFVYHQKGWQRVGYQDGILPIFQKLISEENWEPVYEGNFLIALKKEGKAITIEPAGQFELSGNIYSTLHQTKHELDIHIATLQRLSKELNLAFVPVGFEPLWSRKALDWMPKGRYAIMRDYMPTRGHLGLDMMTRTCTVQVNLDYTSEQDMVHKMRVGMALQPLVTALFASSPFCEGKPTGFQSYRTHVWQDTDPDRCGLLPFVFEKSMGFERYVDYLLKVPMYFLYREGKYINIAGQMFGDHLSEVTLKDWIDHTTVAFPETRLKNFIEMRGADAGPLEMLIALPALWVGLLYDNTVLDQVLQYIYEWPVEAIMKLYHEVPCQGMEGSLLGRPLWAIAQDILKLAHEGLVRRGLGEEIYLVALQHIIETKQNLATRWLHEYHTRWQGDVRQLLLENRF